jgi:TRAP-type mannitol/chloroaromatic compound transport system substrate-binding protein
MGLVAIVVFFTAGCGDVRDAAGPADDGNRAGQDVRLRLASSFNSTAPIQGEALLHLVGAIDAASAGRIQIKVYDPGKLVAAFEVLEAVSDGKVEAGYSTAGYWMGKMPAAPFFTSVPFGPDFSEFSSWLLAGNGMKLYQEMYDQYGFEVKVILCAMTPPDASGWFTEEIRSAEDFRGLKMRIFGLGGNVLQKMGAAVNLLPAQEIFPALEKRVIEATEYASPSIDEDLGFYKIAKFNYFPGWHQQVNAYELIINKSVWEGLSRQDQAIIENASHATVLYSMSIAEATQAPAMIRNERDRGVKNLSWSPEMLALMKEKWEEVAEEKAAQDAFFNKVYRDYKKFRDEYAVWGGKAYLPRGGAGGE